MRGVVRRSGAVEQHQPPDIAALDAPALRAASSVEVEEGGAAPSFFERADLVVHQRDQRADHHREPAGAVAMAGTW